MADIEKLIKEIMRECEKDGEPVTEAEAREMAEMELKAKANRHYEKSEAIKERKPRERKLDDEKVQIILNFADFLKEMDGFDVKNVEIVKKEREITFNIGENAYSVQLVKHRPPKT